MARIPVIAIYKIISPSGKVYIGQSIDIHRRWLDYKRVKYNRSYKLYCSFKKYGVDAHKFEIIEQCLESELNEKEIYYIDLFQTFNSKNGLNIRDGGGSKGRASEETKLKMSAIMKGRVHSPETIEKIASKNRGRKQPKEERENKSKIGKERGFGKWNKGRKATEETLVKLRGKSGEKSASWGKHPSIETRKKMSDVRKAKNASGINSPSSKKVDQIDIQTGEILKTWDWIEQAEKALKLSPGKISAVCKNKRNKTGGFKWQYNVMIEVESAYDISLDANPIIKNNLVKY